AQASRPVTESRIVNISGIRGVTFQQLQHHFLSMSGTLVLAADLHVSCWCPTTGGCQHSLAFDFDHAGTAIAVGTQSDLVFLVTQMRNIDAVAAGRLPNSIRWQGFDLPTFERKGNEVGLFGGLLCLRTHHATSSGKYFMTLRSGLGAAWPSPQIEASIMTC